MEKASEILSGACSPTMLVDYQVAKLAMSVGLIEPYVPKKVSQDEVGARILSYGLEPCGYSPRLGFDFKAGAASLQLRAQILDPKAPPQNSDYRLVHDQRGPLAVERHSVVSGVTIERFKFPADVQGLCIAKSSYTRLGLITQVTGIEPGFEGTLTVQLINTSSQAIWVYPGEGILQILFWLGAVPDTTYTGAFQGQEGVVTGSDRHG